VSEYWMSNKMSVIEKNREGTLLYYRVFTRPEIFAGKTFFEGVETVKTCILQKITSFCTNFYRFYVSVPSKNVFLTKGESATINYTFNNYS
jgi:hypothetical protein